MRRRREHGRTKTTEMAVAAKIIIIVVLVVRTYVAIIAVTQHLNDDRQGEAGMRWTDERTNDGVRPP